MEEYERGLNFEVPAGRVHATFGLNKFGRNPDVDIAADEDIWDGGSDWVPPTAAAVHNLVSTSGADTLAGTGARKVIVMGLDANWEMQKEEVEMAGAVPVPTAGTYHRIFRMYVTKAGTGMTNAGVISATATAPSALTVTAQINANNGQTLMAIYTVPAKHYLFISKYYASLNRSANPAGAMADIVLYAREASDVATAPIRVRHFLSVAVSGSGYINYGFEPYLRLPEKTDVFLRCQDVTDNNTDVSAGFDGFLHDNTIDPLPT